MTTGIASIMTTGSITATRIASIMTASSIVTTGIASIVATVRAGLVPAAVPKGRVGAAVDAATGFRSARADERESSAGRDEKEDPHQTQLKYPHSTSWHGVSLCEVVAASAISAT
jgi:hypothetical protein